jgi:GNAT superfamily N-acetyltransferase
MEACIRRLEDWNVERQYAGGELKSVAVYGVPESWPHIRALYVRHGFVHGGDVEVVLVASVDRLPSGGKPPLPDLMLRRSVGVCGTRIAAVRGEDSVGYIEVEMRIDGDQRTREFGWSDIGNLWVAEAIRRRGIATWLLAAAADWLRLGGVQRLVAYASPAAAGELALFARNGFCELVRTERGWVREA